MFDFIRSLSVRSRSNDVRERPLSEAKRQKLWQRLSLWLLPAESNSGAEQRPTAPGVTRDDDRNRDVDGNRDIDGNGDIDGEWSDCDDSGDRDNNRGCLFCDRTLIHDEHLPIIKREHSIRRATNYHNRVQLHYSDTCFLCVNRLGNHDQHVVLQHHPQLHNVNDDRGID